MEILKDREATITLDVIRARTIGRLHERESVKDFLAVEEPLEIRVELGPEKSRTRKSLSITMRTPGDDFELALGFLFTEGILSSRTDFTKVEFCGPSRNVVRIDLEPRIELDLKKLERLFYTSSSCGVCGKSSIDALRIQGQIPREGGSHLKVPARLLHELPAKLRLSQKVFDSTGGLHACAAFDASGVLLQAREDVGRHNALDKLIGYFFMNDELPLANAVVLVSGRASFELVQKAAMAGVRIFVAVGAPSSLAVQLGQEAQMTLVGFASERRFNIYCGSERILS